MSNLYELTAEYRQAATQLAELDLPDEVVRDTLESMSGDLETKSRNVAAFIGNLEAQAVAIKDAETRMAARRKAIEHRADSIKKYLLDGMVLAGIKSIDCPYFSIKVQDNPPSVQITGTVPGEYLRTPEPPPPAPDKKAIADALKAGQKLDWAHLERSKRVVIK